MTTEGPNELTNELLRVKIRQAAELSDRHMVRVSNEVFDRLVENRIVNAMGNLTHDVSITVIRDSHLMVGEIVPVSLPLK